MLRMKQREEMLSRIANQPGANGSGDSVRAPFPTASSSPNEQGEELLSTIANPLGANGGGDSVGAPFPTASSTPNGWGE